MEITTTTTTTEGTVLGFRFYGFLLALLDDVSVQYVPVLCYYCLAIAGCCLASGVWGRGLWRLESSIAPSLEYFGADTTLGPK